MQWIIVGAFALIFLFLAELRELMRQITRTVEEWRRMRESIEGPRDDQSNTKKDD